MAEEKSAADVLSHLYGIVGVVIGVVSLLISFKVDSPWSEYLLCASGWLATGSYIPLLLRSMRIMRNDAVELGHQRQLVEDLQKELASRNLTLDFVAGLNLGITAVPRVVATKKAEATSANNQGEI